jgi:hypothetical protein
VPAVATANTKTNQTRQARGPALPPLLYLKTQKLGSSRYDFLENQVHFHHTHHAQRCQQGILQCPGESFGMIRAKKRGRPPQVGDGL